MLLVCPRCGAHVEPRVGADGQRICPACFNTGTPQAPAVAAPAAPLARPNAPGAVPSLVTGILSLVLPYVGWILAIIALVQSKKATAAIAASPNAYEGAGFAKAGRILGIICLCLYALFLAIVVAAALVFVLILRGGS